MLLVSRSFEGVGEEGKKKIKKTCRKNIIIFPEIKNI